jgi:type II secretory pathway predicted ATPase ExeA
MYLEHFHLTHLPFTEEPDPEIFFPGARREEICQSLILDILAGKQLIKLVGREGAGKTLICCLIAERLHAEYHVISLANPIGSFDDLLRIVCIELGMNPRGAHDQVNLFVVLQQLLAQRRAEGVTTVLVVDEAEKLFLATLERLVRHVGAKEDELDLIIVLAGRKGLETNLDQMAAFSGNVDMQSGYFLEDLSESETRQYLRYRLNAAGMSREQFAEVFTEGVTAKIFKAGQGNLRMVNLLAEDALKASCAEKSFMVLLERVDPEAVEIPPPNHWLVDAYEVLRSNMLIAGAFVGVAVLALAFGLMLSGVGRQPQPMVQSIPDITQAAGTVSPQDSSQGGAQPSAAREIRDGDKLFRERLNASASWLAGITKGDFTIQLMMLGSNQAQSSIADILTQDDYYPVRDQFFILRKKTTPPTLFVFYGMYDTLDAAREARNNMPAFLRKHHPYPLSISDAVKKIEN